MIFWAICGVLASLATVAVITPLWVKHPLWGQILTFALPLAAVGVYLILGHTKLND
jgi:hypothetical protein